MPPSGEGSVSSKPSRNDDLFPMYCIQRVDTRLRTVNEQAYSPKIIAIGPYHRGENNLEWKEEQKLLYRDALLERKGQNEELYLSVISGLENLARKRYAELPDLTPDEFVRMLLLDGCFIIELFLRSQEKQEIFQDVGKLLLLKQDLLLFENQIPFFILFKLFSLYDKNGDFVKLATEFFRDIFPGVGYFAHYEGNMLENNIHLLGLIHDNWLPSFAGKEPRNENNLKLIPSATELRKAGVMFERAVEGKDLLNIEFEGGTLRIPCLDIKDGTECFFTNLIAYERYYQSMGHRHIISYAKFLNCLIKSEEDVKILCGHGIIQTTLSNEANFQIFNKITESIPENNFHYSDIFSKVNARCRWNRWMERLWHEYLHSPWGFISVLVSSFLFLFGLFQTIYTVVPYYKKSH